VFSDYARPAIRLAALMGQRVIHVLTHDFHRPRRGRSDPSARSSTSPRCGRSRTSCVPALRCVETLECWQLALEARASPSALALTRQNLPQLRTGVAAENRCAAGAYELLRRKAAPRRCRCSPPAPRSPSPPRRATARRSRRPPPGLVSVPCFELFLAAPGAQRAAVVGTASVRIGIEAAIRQGWDAIIGSDGLFVGMSGFGASAPYKDLYRHFGITQSTLSKRRSPNLSTG